MVRDPVRTERLLLRRWCNSDLDPFATINADPEVTEFLAGSLSREQSDAVAQRIREHFDRHGFGLWAVEVPGVADFIGFIGLSIPTFEACFTPCVEVGWRLAREHWGRGYATEGARAALALGFQELHLDEIVSFTTLANRRSRAVMQRLGMRRDPADDFDHPSLPADHPLRRHVLYRLGRDAWFKIRRPEALRRPTAPRPLYPKLHQHRRRVRLSTPAKTPREELEMFDLYTAPTPNGWKASICLEELQLPYEVHVINLMAGDQKTPEYLKLNPNGRIPTIVDRDADNFAVFESGAILIYLAEKTGRLMPADPQGRSLTIQWLMFQMGGIGPMMGQANVFFRYFPEKIQPAIDRYQNECRRLFEVLDARLAEHEWLAGDYSIADIANWSWVRTYKWSGINIEGLLHLRRWMDQMSARPACQKGVEVPFKIPNLEGDEKGAEEFAKNAQTILTR